jgi:formate dehydrogenase subunit gamma
MSTASPSLSPPALPTSVSGLDVVRRVIAERRQLDGPLLPVLHGIQDALGFVPADAVALIAQALNLSRAEVHGVITYYHHFRQAPAGKPVLEVCRAESCRTLGGEALLARAGLDGRCEVQPVYCLGLCAMSPAVALDGQVHARMNAGKLDALLASVGAPA